MRSGARTFSICVRSHRVLQLDALLDEKERTDVIDAGLNRGRVESCEGRSAYENFGCRLGTLLDLRADEGLSLTETHVWRPIDGPACEGAKPTDTHRNFRARPKSAR